MNLYPQDAKLFYKLFLPLLEYTNQRYDVNELKHIVNNDCLNPMQVKEIANVLWDHVELIDDYLEIQASSLTLEEINILKSWKHCQKGTYSSIVSVDKLNLRSDKKIYYAFFEEDSSIKAKRILQKTCKI